jgi:allene oxide cyclase
MKTKFFLFILAMAASLVACGSAPTKTTLKVVERATTDTVADIAPAGDSIGDVLGFGNEVYDETNKSKVGSDNGQCTRTAVGAAWECIWTLTLSDGQITVEGPFYDTSDSTLAITGGTGAYIQAHGEMLLHARNPQGSEYDFTYTIYK